jgi:hypothetical protein
VKFLRKLGSVVHLFPQASERDINYRRIIPAHWQTENTSLRSEPLSLSLSLSLSCKCRVLLRSGLCVRQRETARDSERQRERDRVRERVREGQSEDPSLGVVWNA